MSISSSRWTGPPPSYDASSLMTSTTLTPYLRLPHLLSLAWLAYPILSIPFVLLRIHLSLKAANDSIANAKDHLLASCKAAETSATSAASFPRYLAIASNRQFVHVVNDTLNAARATLVLALTAMEGIINFIIDIYRSTLLCFFELIVRGALAILLGAVDELKKIISSVGNNLSQSVQNDISSANSIIKSAVDVVNKINPFHKIDPPQIPVPDLSSLQNINLPDSFTQALTNLNNSLPSVSDLKNEIESIIDQPFELVKKEINDTFATISFNSSILPIPQQNSVVFCHNMNLSVVDDLGRDIVSVARIGFIVLIVLALVLIGLNCLFIWYQWRCQMSHFEYTRQAWQSDPTLVHFTAQAAAPSLIMTNHNLMLLNAASSHPLIARLTNKLSVLLHLSPSQYTRLQWFLNYIFHPPAMMCFLLGVVGLLSVELQLLALGPIAARYQARAAGAASDFSNLIAASINESMYNQSASYARDVNAQVDVVQNTLNGGVFGWVNSTTVTLNTTVNTFYDDVQKVVQKVFGGTIFENPAQEFIRCFIGGKVDAIEHALTFLHDNVAVRVPRVNESVLVMSPDRVDELTKPIAAAAIGGGPDGKQGVVEKIVSSYAESLKKERLMFAIFIGLWGLVVLMGVAVMLWHSCGRSAVGRYKRMRWKREQRGGVDGLIVPFRMEIGGEKVNGQTQADLPAFTPMPSPPHGTLKFPESSGPASGPGASSGGVTPTKELGFAAMFRERFASGKKSGSGNGNITKLVARMSQGKERFISGPSAQESGEMVRDLPPNTWVKRMKSLTSLTKEKEKEKGSAPLPPPRLQIDITRASFDSLKANENNSKWSASPKDNTSVTLPWTQRTLKKPSHSDPPLLVGPTTTSSSLAPPLTNMSPHVASPSVGPPPAPPARKPSLTPQAEVPDAGGLERQMSLDRLLPPPFAPPLHHGFNDSRYPKLSANARVKNVVEEQTPRTRALTPVSPPVGAVRQSPRQKQRVLFHEMMLWPVPPSAHQTRQKHAHRRSFSLGKNRARPGRAGSVDSTREPENPFVTPFDDEHKVAIQGPPLTMKSVRTHLVK